MGPCAPGLGARPARRGTTAQPKITISSPAPPRWWGWPTNSFLLPEVTAENVGHLHLLIAEFNRLEKPTKEAIRAWVRAHPEVEATREDGKVLRFISKGYTNLSQASILRAYGKKAGERLIKKLKKDGAIEEGKREELWAINDK